MDYDRFIEALESNDWSVRNRSFAYKVVDGIWQIAFIRMGGKFQKPGTVTFVICVRSVNLRNLNGERQEVEKEPHSYPFKLTLAEIDEKRFRYQSKLGNYETTDVATNGDWSSVLRAVETVLPDWLGSYSQYELAEEIAERGEGGYVERVWLEDLSAMTG